MKVALYSCNFGNYRNELSKGIDLLDIDERIDCFFFTDSNTLTSKRWEIIQYDTSESSEFLDKNRFANKKVKFDTPYPIGKYDIIIWIDSKYIFRGKLGLFFDKDLLDYDTILDKIKEYDILHEKHSLRELVEEEIEASLHRERKHRALEYKEAIKNKTQEIPLIELGYFIRKNTKEVRLLLRRTLNSLLEHGLQRDQLIYPFVVGDTKFPINKISLCL